jgi:hypothetical protein
VRAEVAAVELSLNDLRTSLWRGLDQLPQHTLPADVACLSE